MKIEFDRNGSASGLEKIIHNAALSPEIEGVMVFSCDANEFTPRKIDDILKKAPVPVFGAVFPKIILGRNVYEKGSIAVSTTGIVKTLFIPELSNSRMDYEGIIDSALPDAESTKTLLVFADGFSKRIGAFIESLFNIFGLEINYIGGGAGSLSMNQKPCLLTEKGMKTDGAVLVLSGMESGVGVSHGWEMLSGPFRVTESDRNIVKTIDWQPALDVYREVVEPHARRSFGRNDFFDVSKAYPFGISRMESEQIVRDPVLALDDGSLLCVGEIPEGSFVSILHGSRSSLIQAANKALVLGKKAFPPGKRERLRLFMDCISRVLFLEEDFEKELDAVYEKGTPLVGACTIGEIANRGNEFLEFYNKTAVAAVLGD